MPCARVNAPSASSPTEAPVHKSILNGSFSIRSAKANGTAFA